MKLYYGQAPGGLHFQTSSDIMLIRIKEGARALFGHILLSFIYISIS